jgi:PAS domain-containing protein
MNKKLTDLEIDPAVDDVSLREILDQLHKAVQLWDENGHLRFANAVTEVLFGLPAPLYPGCEPGALEARFLLPDSTPIAANDLPFVRVLRDRAEIANLVLRLQRQDGQERWLNINAHPLFESDGIGIRGAITTETDITEFVEQESRLRQLAHYDALTKLPNRALLGDRLHLALARSQRTHEMIAVCLLDLDGFKPVNDHYGHNAGDQVLREVAQRLCENVRGDDTVARLGGDEFALILDRKSTRLNSSHRLTSRMPSSA